MEPCAFRQNAGDRLLAEARLDARLQAACDLVFEVRRTHRYTEFC